MLCADFDDRLNDACDISAASVAPDLAEHAASCAACRANWEGHRLLSDCIVAWRQDVPEVDLTDAVIFALRQPVDITSHISSAAAKTDASGLQLSGSTISTISNRSADTSRRAKRRTWLLAAVSGGVALSIGVALLPVLRPSAQFTTPVAVVPFGATDGAGARAGARDGAIPGEVANSQNETTQLELALLEPNRLEQSRADTDRVPYFDLAQRAAGALGQITLLVLPGNEVTPPDATAEPSAEVRTGWMDEFQRELKPVGRSLGNAFDFLWRAGESADG